jgi:hypothetical protein
MTTCKKLHTNINTFYNTYQIIQLCWSASVCILNQSRHSVDLSSVTEAVRVSVREREERVRAFLHH